MRQIIQERKYSEEHLENVCWRQRQTFRWNDSDWILKNGMYGFDSYEIAVRNYITYSKMKSTSSRN